MTRDGVDVARCTVERLMKDLGFEGARRGKRYVVTTEADLLAERPKDFVKRKFGANAPNKLWVADLTYVRTLAGWVYVAFVIDVFSRKFIGWKVSTSLQADIALDALEMAFRDRNNCEGVVHHSDRVCNISVFATANALQKHKRPHQSEPKAIPTIMPSWRATTDSTNGN